MFNGHLLVGAILGSGCGYGGNGQLEGIFGGRFSLFYHYGVVNTAELLCLYTSTALVFGA